MNEPIRSNALNDANAVDAILLLVIAIFAIVGARRGFLRETLDLIVLVAGCYLALRLYGVVGHQIDSVLGIGAPAAALVGFILVAGSALALLSVVAGTLSRFMSPSGFGLLRLLGGLGGVAIGAGKGILCLGLVLRAGAMLPVDVSIQDQLGRSLVADRIGSAFSAVLPYIEDATNEIASTLTPPPPPIQEGERRQLSLPRDLTVWPDPESEAEMLRLVNEERLAAGLRVLVADEALRSVARSHSQEMFRLAYFAHDSPVSGTPFDRLRRAGIGFALAGENLAYAPTVTTAHRGLMNSPDHRRNILTAGFRRVGIGVIESRLWGKMFSQEFTD